MTTHKSVLAEIEREMPGIGGCPYVPLEKRGDVWGHECPVCGKFVREKPDRYGEVKDNAYGKHFLREADNGR